MVKDLLTRGDMFNLLRILGGLCLVRNKLWFFNETIQVDGRSKPFSEVYQEVLELVEATTEQMVQYQVLKYKTKNILDFFAKTNNLERECNSIRSDGF